MKLEVLCMNPLDSIDTSQYTTANYPLIYNNMQPIEPVGGNRYDQPTNYSYVGYSDSDVDLSDYYSRVPSPENYSRDGLYKAEQDFNNAVADVVQNGITPQNAVNMKMAMFAYKANAEVLKSTFELTV